MTAFTPTKPNLIFPNLVWLLAGASALFAAYFRGLGLPLLIPVAIAGAVPALIGLLLSPVMHREWAQILTIFGWIGLALLGCISFGFVPMALLFIAAPTIAMLFQREKVFESIVITALIAAVAFFAAREGYLPEPPLADSFAGEWAGKALLAALLSLLLSAMVAVSARRAKTAPTATLAPAGETRWRDGVEGGLFEYGADGVLVGVNDQGLAQFGGTAPTQLEAFVPEDGPSGAVDAKAFSAQLASARETKQAVRLRFAHARSGELANYDARLTPLGTGGTLVHTHDRTDDEGQLEALRREHNSAAQDSTDKTLFFAGVSHELRTPLNAIIGFSDMMRSRLFGPLPGKYAEYADLIHDSGQHMLDLIGDVLDLSKVEAGKYELNYDTFDAADVIRSSVKMIRPAADAAEVAIDINLDTDAPLLIQADRRAMRQILLNLLSNAVKFSERGGHIDIDAQAIDGDLELSVSDDGPGMDADEIARIGEPYAQGRAGQLTRERGTGLGLSLVQSLTDLHRGTMDIQSQPDEGTRVRVILPLQDP